MGFGPEACSVTPVRTMILPKKQHMYNFFLHSSYSAKCGLSYELKYVAEPRTLENEEAPTIQQMVDQSSLHRLPIGPAYL